MTKKEEKDFIKKLRLAMLEKGFNQSSLARKLGVSHASVNAWLNAKANPSLAMLEKIARALGEPINYFFADVKGNGNAVGNGAQVNSNGDLKKDIELLSTQIKLLATKMELIENKIQKLEKK